MHTNPIARRTFLRGSGLGLGSIALGSLTGADAGAPARWDGTMAQRLDSPVRARRVIHLCMAGGPSHLETFDYKPKLAELDGQPFPDSFTRGQQLAQLQNTPLKVRGPSCGFGRYGSGGTLVSDYLPHIASVADDIAVVRSMHTEQINHDPAHAFMNTGSIIKGRPSMGSWLLYGLGSECEDLPGYVVLVSHSGRSGQPISSRQWSSGFLPSKFQGIQLQTQGDAVHYVDNPPGVDRASQRELISEVNHLNSLLADLSTDPEIATRIAQYEMAFRMQASVPELSDMSDEPRETLDLYGVREPGDGSFASNCLMARRLAERGVRFIQLYHRGWDHHNDIAKFMPVSAGSTDRPTAALIKDLKQRGMLDDTLVIWGGEFGRTPMGQGTGRDHHINAFSMFLAGGGVRGGVTYGQTDEFGYRYLEDGEQVHVRDLHATMLHLFGIEHTKFTHKFQGLDFKLTGVEPARVLRPLIA